MKSQFSFSTALDHIKGGFRLTRAGWNGKDQWVCYGEGNDNTLAASFWNSHTRAFAESNGGTAKVLPYLILKTAQGAIMMGWAPSNSDVLANDWFLVDY